MCRKRNVLAILGYEEVGERSPTGGVAQVVASNASAKSRCRRRCRAPRRPSGGGVVPRRQRVDPGGDETLDRVGQGLRRPWVRGPPRAHRAQWVAARYVRRAWPTRTVRALLRRPRRPRRVAARPVRRARSRRCSRNSSGPSASGAGPGRRRSRMSHGCLRRGPVNSRMMSTEASSTQCRSSTRTRVGSRGDECEQLTQRLMGVGPTELRPQCARPRRSGDVRVERDRDEREPGQELGRGSARTNSPRRRAASLDDASTGIPPVPATSAGRRNTESTVRTVRTAR